MKNLEPAWRAILDVYQEVAKICDRNGLRYWAAAGTLLGAVRHKGFIPWDDDFDLHMPRPDYEKFIRLADKELPSHLKLVTRANTREFAWNFIKVQDSRRDVYDRVVTETGTVYEQGLYIDIFPLDGVPSCRWARLLERVKFKIAEIRAIRALQSGKHRHLRGWLGEVVGIFLWPFFIGLKTERDFVELYERWSMRIPFETARCVGLLWYPNRDWEWTAPKSAFDQTVRLSFMNMTIPCPSGYDMTLRAHYGDYMKLPPESEWKSCHNGWGDAPWKFGPTGHQQVDLSNT